MKIQEKFNAFIDFIRDVFVHKDEVQHAEGNDLLLQMQNDKGDLEDSRSINIVKIVLIFLAIFFIWAYFFHIDEVSKGDGKVIPISKEQVIQSLDGGILSSLNVTDGQKVKVGEVLATLDQTRALSGLEEAEARYRALLATQARLNAEVYNSPLIFPDELSAFPGLVRSETNLYESRKSNFENSIKNIQESKVLITKELDINKRLSAQGAASAVDVIRLQRQLVELSMKEAELKERYRVKSSEDLSKVRAELESLEPTISGKRDLVAKSIIHSPVNGIVKDIEVTTRGGVIPPNGTLMHIVPMDDALLVEARISPRDVAFIHPGQEASVKITAYDYSIYGSLHGEVTTISPDTIKDEVKPDIVYYRVYIKTDRDYLENKKGVKFYISPGMVATVDIKTGSRTILQYIMKPFNKLHEALRER